MNNETKLEISEMIAEFTKRQEEICSEIENIKKSTDALKDSIRKQYEVVSKEIASDMEYIAPFVKSINDKIGCVDTSYDELRYFSVFNVSNINTWIALRAYSYGNDNSVKILASDCNMLSQNGTLMFDRCDGYSEFRAERLVHYYRSGLFTKHIIDVIQETIKITLNKYESIKRKHQQIIENATPVSDKGAQWKEYIMYLLKWSSEHADKEFAGMSPACYDEWLDNEYNEED